METKDSLTAEAVEGTALAFQGIDHIHGSDGLPLGVFGIGDSVTDDILKEDLEDATGLLIDETRDTLDTATTSQSPDGGLSDALDVVSQHFSVPLGTAFSESLSSFASSGHCRFADVSARKTNVELGVVDTALYLFIADVDATATEEQRGARKTNAKYWLTQPQC